MSEILNETDLTKVEGDPGARATWYGRLESCHMELGMPAWLGGLMMKLETQTAEGSPLAIAITAVMLTVAGCTVAGVSVLAGASLPLTTAAFLTPSVLFVLIFLTVRLTRGQAKLADRNICSWRPAARLDASGRSGSCPGPSDHLRRSLFLDVAAAAVASSSP